MWNCEGRVPQLSEYPRSRHPRCRVAILPLAMCLAGVVGCGVGDYRQAIESTVRDFAMTSEAGGLYAPQAIGDRPISVRIPQVFRRQPLVDGTVVAGEGSPPAEVRVQPGLIDLPGLTYTYEEFVEDAEGGQIPYYLHVGAADTQRSGFRDPTSRWVNQLTERFPQQNIGWEEVGCDTPDGRRVVWRRLRAEGEQPFYYVSKDGQGREQRMPGVFEVYYRVDGNWAVALAWRVPSMIAGHANIDKWAPIVAGAVDFSGGAGGGAP